MKKIVLFSTLLALILFSGCSRSIYVYGKMDKKQRQLFENLCSGSDFSAEFHGRPKFYGIKRSHIDFRKDLQLTTMCDLYSQSKLDAAVFNSGIMGANLDSRRSTGLNIPLDRLLAVQMPVRLLLPDDWHTDPIALWNIFAALRIADGTYDEERTLREFLLRYYPQSAEKLYEFFCFCERTAFFVSAMAGITREKEPDISCVFRERDQQQLLQYLDAAVSASSGKEKEKLLIFRKDLQKNIQQINESEYSKAKEICPDNKPHPLLSSHGKKAVIPTTVSLQADSEKMTLHFECMEDRMQQLRLKRTSADGAGIWYDDNVEFFMQFGRGKDRKKYQFIISANGSHYCRTFSPDDKYSHWKFENIKISVKHLPDRWLATVSLPWKSFGLSGIPEKKWRTNFFRNRYAAKHWQPSAWTPMFNNPFFKSDLFGIINWSKK